MKSWVGPGLQLQAWSPRDGRGRPHPHRELWLLQRQGQGQGPLLGQAGPRAMSSTALNKNDHLSPSRFPRVLELESGGGRI